MAYILGDIVTRVQQRVRDTGYSSTEIKGYINDTQRDVFNEYRLSPMEATQDYTLNTGTADITNGSGLPSSFVQAVDIFLKDSGKEKLLTYMSYQEIDNRYPDASDSTIYPNNVPQFWYKYGDTINVFPAPNEDYAITLRYYKSPTTLSGDDDVPELPSEFEELLVVGAAYRVLQVKDNYDQAAILQNKYDEILQKFAYKYAQRQAGHSSRMRINRSGLGKTSY